MNSLDFSMKQGEASLKIFMLPLLTFLFLIGIVSAVPPVTQVQQFATGYVIADAKQYTLVYGEEYTYHFFLYNASNGVVITNESVTCELFSADKNGVIVTQGNVSFDTAGKFWYYYIAPYVYPEAGYYSFGVNCQNTNAGGALASYFEVRPQGFDGGSNSIAFAIIFILLTWGVAFIGFFGRNEWVTIFGGMGMMIFGIYTLTQGIIIYEDWITQVISYFSLGLGGFFMLYTLVEYIRDF